jgi:hypothetical protein
MPRWSQSADLEVIAIPRYLVERHAGLRAELAAATRLANLRFPEVAVEHRYELRPSGGTGDRELWVCRAPSEAHVRSWTSAAGLTFDGIALIDGDEVG